MGKADWRTEVHDPEARWVFEALENPQYQWRTVRGIIRESGLSEAEVRRVLDTYPELIMKSRQKDSGVDIYTIRKRFYERMSPIQQFWHFLPGSSSSTST